MNAANTYALNHDQIANAIIANGAQSTMLIEGETGIGKSTLLKQLAAALPTHKTIYFDCTTADLGDLMLPNIGNNAETGAPEAISFLPNEELGLHLNQPIILMLDEFGKANPAVKTALARLILERQLAGCQLHPDSIVFATTNLGTEGLGDLIPAHQRNRITSVQMRKPTSDEWLEWGVANGVNHTILGWVKDNPQVLQSFMDVPNPDDNPYIHHPAATGRASFVTPRSLAKAASWLDKRASLDDTTLTAVLMGTIGQRAALDLMAWVTLADKLPKLDEIKKYPGTAPVPDSPAAICMIVYRTLSLIDKSWVESWLEYMNRLSPEAQGLFVNGARSAKYPKDKQAAVFTSKKMVDWCRANGYMYSADKA